MARVGKPPKARRTASGIYEAVWYHKGEEITRTLNTSDPVEVADKLKPIVAEWQLNGAVGRAITFAMAATLFFEAHQDQAGIRDKETMWATIKHDWEHRVIAATGADYFSSYFTGLLNGTVKRRFIHKRRSKEHDGDALDKASVRNIQRLLKRFRNYMRDCGRLASYQLPDWPKSYGANRPKKLWHRPEQIHAMMKAARLTRKNGEPITRLEILVALGYGTGARQDDIHNLKTTDIDFDRGKVNYADMRVVNGVDRRPPNKRAGRPDIGPDLLPILREAVAAAKAAGSKYVLRRPTSLKHEFAALIDAVGIGGSMHTMRHTYVTIEVQAGTPIPDVAEAVGDSPAIILKVYGHHAPDKNKVGHAVRLFGGEGQLKLVKG